MQRTIINNPPDLILTSDWHLREDTPTCFVGQFQLEQWLCVTKVAKLQEQYKCPVIHAGDLFHHWKPSPWLLSQAFDLLPKDFYTVYGQHDLPQHNWDLRGKSGIKTLETAKRLTVLTGCHYGGTPSEVDNARGEIPVPKNILVWHHLTYITVPFPGATGGNAYQILQKYPLFDLIVTGDNHQAFTAEKSGRLLVNPGPLTRQAASHLDFKPRVYLWFQDTNTAIPVYLPIQEGAITREHITVKEERDTRIDAFINKLDGDWKAEMSFEENLERFKKANNIDDEVMKIIYKAIE